MTSATMTPQLPLQGVRVVEICNVAAGPFGSMLLADLGATVIKVENPAEPDYVRTFPPFVQGEAGQHCNHRGPDDG